MKEYTELQSKLDASKADYDKFMAGNKAAGTRLRKAMQDIKQLAQAVRNEVSARKNG